MSRSRCALPLRVTAPAGWGFTGVISVARLEALGSSPCALAVMKTRLDFGLRSWAEASASFAALSLQARERALPQAGCLPPQALHEGGDALLTSRLACPFLGIQGVTHQHQVPATHQMTPTITPSPHTPAMTTDSAMAAIRAAFRAASSDASCN